MGGAAPHRRAPRDARARGRERRGCAAEASHITRRSIAPGHEAAVGTQPRPAPNPTRNARRAGAAFVRASVRRAARGRRVWLHAPRARFAHISAVPWGRTRSYQSGFTRKRGSLVKEEHKQKNQKNGDNRRE